MKRSFIAPALATGIALALKNVGVALALSMVAFAAQAAVVTFDSAPYGAPFAPHTEDEFTVSTHSGFLFNSDFGNPGNNLEAKLGTDGGVAAFVAADGSLFTFTGLDYALFTGIGSGRVTLNATGFRDGIAIGTESYALGFSHFQHQYTDWTTFHASNLAGLAIDELRVALELGFVSSSSRSTGYFQAIDNVTFGEAAGPGPGVPEPATWAMMIIGFGAVGGALRRRPTRVSFT